MKHIILLLLLLFYDFEWHSLPLVLNRHGKWGEGERRRYTIAIIMLIDFCLHTRHQHHSTVNACTKRAVVGIPLLSKCHRRFIMHDANPMLYDICTISEH